MNLPKLREKSKLNIKIINQSKRGQKEKEKKVLDKTNGEHNIRW